MAEPALKRIPLIGNQLYRVGQVYDIIAQPCTPVPSITVKAMFANLPMLVWSLFKPDPVDFLTERFGSVHKRRRKGRFTIQDVDIGLPKGGGGIRNVEFATVKLLERVGWYFLVVDATVDFSINWMSMAYRYSGCQDPLSGYAQTIHTGGLAWLSDGSDFYLSLGSPSFTAGYFASSGGVQKLTAGPRAVSASVNFGHTNQGTNGQPTAVVIEQTIGSPADVANMDLSGEIPTNINSASGVYRGYNILEPPGAYVVRVSSTPGWIFVTDWKLQISGFDQPGLEPDP